MLKVRILPDFNSNGKGTIAILPPENRLDFLSTDPTLVDLRSAWFRLALGVATHRYFLHVDRALKGVTGRNFSERSDFFNPMYVDPDNREIASFNDVRPHSNSKRRANSGSVKRELGSNLLYSPFGGVIGLGAHTWVTVADGKLPAWARLIGLVALSPDKSDLPTLPVVAGCAARSLFLGFLFAQRFEDGDSLSMDIVADDLEREYGTVADSIAAISRSIAFMDTPARADISLVERAIVELHYLPARDFALTVLGGRSFCAMFATGLAIGQS